MNGPDQRAEGDGPRRVERSDRAHRRVHPADNGPNRIHALDALRGLAALTVVFHHLALVPPEPPSLGLTTWVITGYAAVLLFFLLSGFVLYLSLEQRPQPYPEFVVKRIARIYLPYAAVLLLSYALLELNAGAATPGLSAWAGYPWRLPEARAALWPHLALLGTFDFGLINPVVWSLVVEMRVSLIFPMIALLVRRAPWFVSLGVGLLCSSVKELKVAALAGTLWLRTSHYVLLFVVGALLAKHRAVIRSWVGHHPRLSACLGLLGIGAYYLHDFWRTPSERMRDYLIAIGATIFIVLTLGNARIERLLSHPWLRFLGEVSYSLYLVHAVVLLSLLHFLGEKLPLWVLLTAMPFLSLAAAALLYRFVERPSMRLGRLAAEWLRRRSWAR